MTGSARPHRALLIASVIIAAFVVIACHPSEQQSAPATSAQGSPPVEPDRGSGEGTGGSEEVQAEQIELARARLEAIREARRAGTLGRTGPLRPIPTAGWGTEHVWSAPNDDWEPALAAAPSGPPWVYQAATRYYGPKACRSCPAIATVMRASSDGGKTWGPSRYVCRCPGKPNQFDPLIETDGEGNVYAALLQGYRPGVSFAKSDDNGKSWTRPVSMPGVNWSDKPVMAVSHDGKDIYISFNGPSKGDVYVGISHNGGASFATTKVTNADRYFFAGNAWISFGGKNVVFAENDFNQQYTGKIHQDAVVSHDGGATWQVVRVATVARQPNCPSKGCYDGFYGSVPSVGGDRRGNLVFVYAGATVARGPQRVYVRRSTDGGLTWHGRHVLSPDGTVNALTPTIVGDAAGTLRLWWMDDRTGRLNVWYRDSADHGTTWSAPVRISNATGGTAYKGHKGFLEMYGDYGEIAVTSEGMTVATWGEGPSYDGPGGVWFNRQR